MRHDLVVRNGIVVDGTRAPRYRADVAVNGDRIASIGQVIEGEARVEIDATGLVVAPGFIDAHTHDDRLMLSAPDMAPKVSQGVTTVVAGNCGISLAPAPRGMSAPVLPPIDLLDGEGAWFRFPTFHSYVEELKTRQAATNCALLVGHTMLRAQAMDDLQRPAREPEIEQMRKMTAEALQAGAIGVSTGLYYEPARAAPQRLLHTQRDRGRQRQPPRRGGPHERAHALVRCAVRARAPGLQRDFGGLRIAGHCEAGPQLRLDARELEVDRSL